MIAIFSLPLFAAWTLLDPRPPAAVRNFRLLLTLGTMMVMGAMVFLKQHMLDRELLSLLQASRDAFDNLQRLHAQLVQSEKLASLGQLVGGAAHELNNPITAMSGYSELLSSSRLNDEQRTLAEKIGQQVRRVRGLVASLLSFAKNVSGDKSPLDLSSVAQTAVKLCQPQVLADQIQLRCDLASDLPQVLGDPNQLLQVCLHILNNSRHVLHETGGGTLTVSTRREGSQVILEFGDTGPGLRDPNRALDPFATIRAGGKGAELGLSACNGIVREHKGNITCLDRAQGGVIFRIELPGLRENLNATYLNSSQQLSQAMSSGVAPGTPRP
jgi:signal transduction histidine kinase